MPTSPLYARTRAALAARLPHVRASQLDPLALVLVGITQSVSAQLGAIARAMPLDTTQYGKAQRLRRLLRSEEHTSELQSRQYLVCRLLLEKKNNNMSSY